MGEVTPQQPQASAAPAPAPKKSAMVRLKDYVLSAATSPEVLLPVFGIVATSNKVSLYDAQLMLLDPAFYGDANAHWAVNLAGHTQMGMVVRGLPDGALEVGNVDANIVTALVVTPLTEAD